MLIKKLLDINADIELTCVSETSFLLSPSCKAYEVFFYLFDVLTARLVPLFVFGSVDFVVIEYPAQQSKILILLITSWTLM